MSTDVVELQRKRIETLESREKELTLELCDKYQTIADLSHVLAHLTDGRFREFAASQNWNRVITEFLEGEDT